MYYVERVCIIYLDYLHIKVPYIIEGWKSLSPSYYRFLFFYQFIFEIYYSSDKGRNSWVRIKYGMNSQVELMNDMYLDTKQSMQMQNYYY